MINCKLIVYLTASLVSCKADGNNLEFDKCYLNIPNSFDKVTNTLAIEEFIKFKGTEINIIQLTEASSEFESSLKSTDFNSVESFKHEEVLVYRYNFNIKKFSLNVKNITIVAKDKQLNLQGLSDSDVTEVLSNCYDQKLIEKLISL